MPLPSHVQDQLDAATRETSKNLDLWRWLAGDVLGEELVEGAPKKDDPLTRKLLVEPAEAGELTFCEHLTSPAPCHVLASHPGRVLCSACMRRKMKSKKWRQWARRDVCDGCGEETDVLGSALVTRGPIMTQGFLCDACAKEVSG